MAKHGDIDHTGVTGVPAAEAFTEAAHDAHDHTGVTGVGGGGLTFTAVSRELVFNASTTAASIGLGLTPAIAAVPADAVLCTGYLQIASNGAPANGNSLQVSHENASADVAAIVFNNVASGLVNNVPFTCKVHQSSGSKIYYSVARSANTITYSLAVTGYWAPA